MEQFTNTEMADMHIVYGEVHCNGRAAARLYAERYPNRRAPNYRMFANLHRNLCEYGTFSKSAQDTGRTRMTRTPALEEEILRRVEEAPGTSTRTIARDIAASQSSVWRTLHREHLHPYHLQRVQSLQPEDYPGRVEFAHWYLDKCNQNPAFPSFSRMKTFSVVKGSSINTMFMCGATTTHEVCAHMLPNDDFP